jgi:hypothetical protein
MGYGSNVNCLFIYLFILGQIYLQITTVQAILFPVTPDYTFIQWNSLNPSRQYDHTNTQCQIEERKLWNARLELKTNIHISTIHIVH